MVQGCVAQRPQRSWKRILQTRLGKEPIIEVDMDREQCFKKAMDVINVLSNLGSWRGDRVIFESLIHPNG